MNATVFVGRLCQARLLNWRFAETPYNLARVDRH